MDTLESCWQGYFQEIRLVVLSTGAFQLPLHAVSNVTVIRGIVETQIGTPNPVTMLQECREQLKTH